MGEPHSLNESKKNNDVTEESWTKNCLRNSRYVQRRSKSVIITGPSYYDKNYLRTKDKKWHERNLSPGALFHNSFVWRRDLTHIIDV